MTEGLIQKWANKYHNERLTLMIINELIEKIKQEAFERELTPKKQWIVLLYDLIGDNE